MANVTVMETGGNEVGYHTDGSAHKVKTYYRDYVEGQAMPTEARTGDRLMYINWGSLDSTQQAAAGSQLWIYSADTGWNPI